MSGRFKLDAVEARKIFKVFLWTMASAFVALAISLIGILELPTEYAFVIPFVNTILYALAEFIKDNQAV